MKVAVCFKIIADLNMPLDRDWNVVDQGPVDLSFVRQVFNCFDESSLEMGLKLQAQSEAVTDKIELTALTIDDQRADLFLKHLYALAYDHAVRIQPDDPMDLVFHPLWVSAVLSAYIADIGRQQLVILGMQGGEGNNGQTGYLVAERLGWPCIRNVMDIALKGPENGLTVTSMTDRGTMMQTIDLPAVLITGNSPQSPFLRVPTLKQKVKASTRQITALGQKELGVKDKGMIRKDKAPAGLYRPESSRKVVFIEGKTAEDKARTLYEQSLKDRLNQ